MKAMVLTAFNAPLERQDLPMPTPGARDALARVHACGSGLTLHHSVTGNLPTDRPIVLGHEVVGEVVEVGSEAEGDLPSAITLPLTGCSIAACVDTAGPSASRCA